MTKRQDNIRPTAKATLEEALAVLIASSRSKKRPLPLTDVARWLEVAVNNLGGFEAVAERIGLSSKMLRQFSYVGRLSRNVQALFESRKLDSVDAATHLAMLAKKDQEVVAKCLVNGAIDTSDLRAVVQLRDVQPQSPINDLVERVSASRTQQHYAAEFVVRGTTSRTQILKHFKRYLDENDIVSLEIDGPIGRVVFTREGKKQLVKIAKDMRVPVRHVISSILYGSAGT